MNIGEVAETSGVSAKMIRYYESIGLVPKPARTGAGYRVYSDRDIHTLAFIRRARDLGFSIEQISELVALWRDRDRASTDVKRIAMEHVDLLERKAQNLQEMASTLRHLAKNCRGDRRPECPIIEGLASEEGGLRASGPSRRLRATLPKTARSPVLRRARS
jgi:MerR family copper efflux transcriptional regulator